MKEYIEKQAAIGTVTEALMSWSHMAKWRDDKIIEAVMKMPPADVPGIELKGRPIDAQPIIDRIKKAIEFAEKYNLRSDGTEELRSVLNDLEAAQLIGREAGE